MHSETIKKEDIRSLTRKVLDVTVPGTRYGEFYRYQLRRCMSDDSGLWLLVAVDDSNDVLEIMHRYSRDEEWEYLTKLCRLMYSSVGCRSPDFMWPEGEEPIMEAITVEEKE